MSVTVEESKTENQSSVSKRLLWQIEKLSPHLEEMAVEEAAGVIAILQIFGPTPEVVRKRVLAAVETLTAKLERVSPEDCQTIVGLLAALCKARSIDEQRREQTRRALAIR